MINTYYRVLQMRLSTTPVLVLYSQDAIMLSPDGGSETPIDSKLVMSKGEDAHDVDDNGDGKGRAVARPQQLGFVRVLLDLRCDVDPCWREGLHHWRSVSVADFS